MKSYIQACEIEVEMPVDFIELDLQGIFDLDPNLAHNAIKS